MMREIGPACGTGGGIRHLSGSGVSSPSAVSYSEYVPPGLPKIPLSAFRGPGI